MNKVKYIYYFAPKHLKYDLDSCAVYSLQTEVKNNTGKQGWFFPLFYTHCTEKVSDWPNRETLLMPDVHCRCSEF